MVDCPKTPLLLLMLLDASTIEFAIGTHMSCTEHLLWVKDVSIESKSGESQPLPQAWLPRTHEQR